MWRKLANQRIFCFFIPCLFLILLLILWNKVLFSLILILLTNLHPQWKKNIRSVALFTICYSNISWKTKCVLIFVVSFYSCHTKQETINLNFKVWSFNSQIFKAWNYGNRGFSKSMNRYRCVYSVMVINRKVEYVDKVQIIHFFTSAFCFVFWLFFMDYQTFAGHSKPGNIFLWGKIIMIY